MSETDKPRPETGAGQESGAEAPAQPERPEEQPQAAAGAAQAPPAQRVPEQPTVRQRSRVPGSVRTWVAAVVGAVLLLGGGVGGYFIGAANDHDNGRPGLSRYHDYVPGPPGDRGGPFRGERPGR